ncbi:MAG: hypothetical protein R2699_03175 [Acidimicrobiales bacterium]
MLGADQPVILQMLEITPALDARAAWRWSWRTAPSRCWPAWCRPTTRTRPSRASTWRCSGQSPRSKGMERKDLLEANGAIFTVQGKALSDHAADDVRILVVGNPANTNCLIAMNNGAEHPVGALHRHDPPRPQPGDGPAGQQGRRHRQRRPSHDDLGNHSATQYLDLYHAEVNGQIASDAVADEGWIDATFIPTVQQRAGRHHRGPGPVERSVGGQRRHRPRA